MSCLCIKKRATLSASWKNCLWTKIYIRETARSCLAVPRTCFVSKTMLKRSNFNVSLKILPYLGFLQTWKKLLLLQDFSRIVVSTYVGVLRIINSNDLCKSGCIIISTELFQLVNLGVTWPFEYDEHTFLTWILIFIVNSTMQDFSFCKTCESWIKRFMGKSFWAVLWTMNSR